MEEGDMAMDWMFYLSDASTKIYIFLLICFVFALIFGTIRYVLIVTAKKTDDISKKNVRPVWLMVMIGVLAALILIVSFIPSQATITKLIEPTVELTYEPEPLMPAGRLSPAAVTYDSGTNMPYYVASIEPSIEPSNDAGPIDSSSQSEPETAKIRVPLMPNGQFPPGKG